MGNNNALICATVAICLCVCVCLFVRFVCERVCARVCACARVRAYVCARVRLCAHMCLLVSSPRTYMTHAYQRAHSVQGLLLLLAAIAHAAVRYPHVKAAALPTIGNDPLVCTDGYEGMRI